MKMTIVSAASMAVLVSATPLSAQSGPAWQTRAVELAKRLAGTGATAFAAQVPNDPSRFVAALHIPGVQLLVISATYASPVLLRELMLKQDYQGVYRELNAAANRQGQLFIEDLGADGLRPDRERDAPFDITWRDMKQRTLYNGSWKDQQLSEAEYRTRFETDAAEYAGVLDILLTAHTAHAAIRQQR
jgi:hypothetical protein